MNDEADLMGHVVDEFMRGMEQKDKALVMDALRALLMQIQEEDEQQDEGA